MRDDGWIGTYATPSVMTALHTNHFAIASGASFPDALSAGPLGGYSRFPLLLTPKDSLSKYIVDYYLLLPHGTNDFYTQAGMPYWGKCLVMGGTGAVSSRTQVLLGGALGGADTAIGDSLRRFLPSADR